MRLLFVLAGRQAVDLRYSKTRAFILIISSTCCLEILESRLGLGSMTTFLYHVFLKNGISFLVFDGIIFHYFTLIFF